MNASAMMPTKVLPSARSSFVSGRATFAVKPAAKRISLAAPKRVTTKVNCSDKEALYAA